METVMPTHFSKFEDHMFYQHILSNSLNTMVAKSIPQFHGDDNLYLLYKTFIQGVF